MLISFQISTGALTVCILLSVYYALLYSLLSIPLVKYRLATMYMGV